MVLPNLLPFNIQHLEIIILQRVCLNTCTASHLICFCKSISIRSMHQQRPNMSCFLALSP
uniref:Putative lysine-specific demethylase JMJ16 n=1 Tax=Rhizophora mucronata TaxID=61149 RepID=A0A2P2KGU8_RHIMU